MCALCIAFCRESLKTDQHRSSLMAFARLLSRTSAKGPLLWPAAHLFVRQHKPVGSIACTHHQQPMSDGVPVSHPVATAKDQLAWEQVLQQHESQHPANSGVPATAHPAVGASQAECEEWEAALSTSTNAAPLQVAPCSAEQGVYAVVECGSHTTRLLLSTGTADIARINHDTHLAAVLSAAASPASGQHPQLPAGSEATLAAVREYKQRIDVHQGDLRGVRAIATAAVRDAPEGPAIAAAVHAILQRPVEVLSGKAEAQLAFKGATAGLYSNSSRGPCLVIDLGGRSTEFAVGSAGSNPWAVASIPLGCLSISQAACQSDSNVEPTADLLQAAKSILDAHKADVERLRAEVQALQQQQDEALTVIATGGTVTTLSALQLGLKEYVHTAVHMSVLQRSDIEGLMMQLCAAETPQMWPAWLTPARAASLAPGCAGLLVLMEYLSVEHFVVSDCDLLDGVVADMKGCQGPSGTG